MAGDTVITVVGNLVADPDLRYTNPSGDRPARAVANVRIASTARFFDRQSGEWKDGETLFIRGTVWGDVAEHVASSLTKGSRVIATGRLRPSSSYETKEGETRTSMEFEVDEIGPSLRFASAQVQRQSSGAQPQASVGGAWSAPDAGGATQDPWAKAATSNAPPIEDAPF